MNKEICVFAEHKNGEISEISLELICEGRRIAALMNEELTVILMGKNLTPMGDAIAAYGANRVLLVDHDMLSPYHPEIHTAVLAEIIKARKPGTFLMSETVRSRDLAPRVAARLRAGLASGCDKLLVDKNGLRLNRLTHRNKIHTTISLSDNRPGMATVTSGIAKIKKTKPVEACTVTSIDPAEFILPETEKIRITRFIKADPKTIDISDAELIVSGGRGAGDENGFALVRNLADALNAAVAGSRVAVDNQWIGKQRQIGQSGKSVSPDLMISCGVSGASAHTFGMRETGTLIAINKDKAAPIMKMADLGVVGDMKEILPELIEKINSIKKEGANGN
jgi:electron transfer flavoprotein alpha subunit